MPAPLASLRNGSHLLPVTDLLRWCGSSMTLDGICQQCGRICLRSRKLPGNDSGKHGYWNARIVEMLGGTTPNSPVIRRAAVQIRILRGTARGRFRGGGGECAKPFWAHQSAKERHEKQAAVAASTSSMRSPCQALCTMAAGGAIVGGLNTIKLPVRDGRVLTGGFRDIYRPSARASRVRGHSEHRPQGRWGVIGGDRAPLSGQRESETLH